MIRFEALTKADTVERWQSIRAFIDSACEQDIERKVTSGELYTEVMRGRCFVLTIHDDDLTIGAAVMCRTPAYNGNCLMIRALGGERMSDWLEGFSEYIESVARMKGATDGVLFCGRLGWIPALKKLGYKPVFTVMYKKLEGVNHGR